MAQFDFGNLESPLSGTKFINENLEPWRDALHSSHSGTARPSYVVPGMIWIDTTTNPWVLKVFNGSDDIIVGTLNTSTLAFGFSGGAVENTPIGQTTPAAGTFTNLRYTVDIDFSSDRRLKKNIKPLTGMLEKLLQLQAVSFQRRQGSNRTQLGFIAQDVQKVLPNLVSEGEDGMLTLHGMDMDALLVAAVAELAGEINQLKQGK